MTIELTHYHVCKFLVLVRQYNGNAKNVKHHENVLFVIYGRRRKLPADNIINERVEHIFHALENHWTIFAHQFCIFWHGFHSSRAIFFFIILFSLVTLRVCVFVYVHVARPFLLSFLSVVFLIQSKYENDAENWHCITSTIFSKFFFNPFSFVCSSFLLISCICPFIYYIAFESVNLRRRITYIFSIWISINTAFASTC